MPGPESRVTRRRHVEGPTPAAATPEDVARVQATLSVGRGRPGPLTPAHVGNPRPTPSPVRVRGIAEPSLGPLVEPVITVTGVQTLPA